MYLVMLRHTMDDLPVRLFPARDEAMQYASSLTWYPSEQERRIFHSDCSTPVSISIVELDPYGVPQAMETVRSFDEEEQCPSSK